MVPCGGCGAGSAFKEVKHAVKPLLTAAATTEVADDQLVAAVREGSEEAFELLYRRYRPRIVAYVRALQRAGTGTIEDVPENRRGELTGP